MEDHDEIEALRREVRRLKAQMLALEEEKEDPHRRYVFVCQELERTRAKLLLAVAPLNRERDGWVHRGPLVDERLGRAY